MTIIRSEESRRIPIGES